MISHKHKFILITPQKTASVSLTQALLPYCSFKKIIPQDHLGDCFDYNDEFGRESKHFPIRRLLNQWSSWKPSRREKFPLPSYLKIGSVRNPWARMLSWYFWPRRQPQHFSRKGFASFIQSKGRNQISNHFSHQGQVVVDLFIRVENLQEDFNIACDKIGIPSQELPYKNKTNHKHYTEYYDDKTRDIIAEKHIKDIEYFGYEFGE